MNAVLMCVRREYLVWKYKLRQTKTFEWYSYGIWRIGSFILNFVFVLNGYLFDVNDCVLNHVSYHLPFSVESVDFRQLPVVYFRRKMLAISVWFALPFHRRNRIRWHDSYPLCRSIFGTRIWRKQYLRREKVKWNDKQFWSKFISRTKSTFISRSEKIILCTYHLWSNPSGT